MFFTVTITSSIFHIPTSPLLLLKGSDYTYYSLSFLLMSLLSEFAQH